MSEIVEYPKSLYAKGWDDLSDTVVVNDKKEERAARKNGYKMLDAQDDAAEVEEEAKDPQE